VLYVRPRDLPKGLSDLWFSCKLGVGEGFVTSSDLSSFITLQKQGFIFIFEEIEYRVHGEYKCAVKPRRWCSG